MKYYTYSKAGETERERHHSTEASPPCSTVKLAEHGQANTFLCELYTTDVKIPTLFGVI